MIAISKVWYISVLNAAVSAVAITSAAATSMSTSTTQQYHSYPRATTTTATAFIHPSRRSTKATASSSHQYYQRDNMLLLMPQQQQQQQARDTRISTITMNAIPDSSSMMSHSVDDDDNTGSSSIHNDSTICNDTTKQDQQHQQQDQQQQLKSIPSIRMTTTAVDKNEVVSVHDTFDTNGNIDNTDNDKKKVVFYPFNDTIESLQLQSVSSLPVSSSTTTIDTVDRNINNTSTTSSSSSMGMMKHQETTATKKVRVAKAQAEIDRILSQPENAPFDIEKEIQNVISISISPSSNDSTSSSSGSNTDDAIATTSSSSSSSLIRSSSSNSNGSSDKGSTTKTDTTMIDRIKRELIHRHEEDITNYDSIENQLYTAIRQEDYNTAHVNQQILQQMQLDNTLQVLQCNAAFYKAFSKKDYQHMNIIWLPNDNHVMCIHPSHIPIISSHNIQQSWKQMFTSTNANFQKTWIEPCNIRISIKGNNMAIVTCDEQVFVRRFVRGQKRQTELINTLIATNIYRKINDQWFMIHHHASWHPSSDAAKSALSRSSSSSSSNTGASSSYIASLRKRQEAIDNENQNNKDTKNNNNLGLDGILGMKDIGPLLGDIKPKKSLLQNQQQQQPPQRRIVMGSLSDILNGNLEDLLNGSGSGSTKNSDKKGSNDDNDDDDDDDDDDDLEGGAAIIQFHRIESEDDDDDDLDIDDDDDDDDIDGIEIEITNDTTKDNDDDSSSAAANDAVSMIQEWATKKASNKSKSSNSSSSNNYSSTGKKDSKITNNNERNENIEMSQKKSNEYMKTQCVSLIRELCMDGLISKNHKRILLSDMISYESGTNSSNSSSSNTKSPIQVAYEFLFASISSTNIPADQSTKNEDSNNTMYDIIKEEFADQCRMIADTISNNNAS